MSPNLQFDSDWRIQRFKDDLQELHNMSILKENLVQLDVWSARPALPPKPEPSHERDPYDEQEPFLNPYNIYTTQGLFCTIYKTVRSHHSESMWRRLPKSLKHPFFRASKAGYKVRELTYFGITAWESFPQIRQDYFLRSLHDVLATGFPMKLISSALKLNERLRKELRFNEPDLDFAAFERFVHAWGGIGRSADKPALEKSLTALLGLVGGEKGMHPAHKEHTPLAFTTVLGKGKYRCTPALLLNVTDAYGLAPRVAVFDLPEQYMNQGLKQFEALYALANGAGHPKREKYHVTAIFRVNSRASVRILTAFFTPSWLHYTSSSSEVVRAHAPPIDGRCILPPDATCHITYTPWIPLFPQHHDIQQWKTERKDKITDPDLKTNQDKCLMPSTAQEREGHIRLLGALLGPFSEALGDMWRGKGGAQAFICEQVIGIAEEKLRMEEGSEEGEDSE